MANKKAKRTKKKQRRSFLAWIDKIAVALYWFAKLVLLLVEWFTR